MPEIRCTHSYVNTDVTFTVLEGEGRYMADVKITCQHCGEKFVFVGMPLGVSHNGPSASADGTEARLCVVPQREAKRLVGGQVNRSSYQFEKPKPEGSDGQA